MGKALDLFKKQYIKGLLKIKKSSKKAYHFQLINLALFPTLAVILLWVILELWITGDISNGLKENLVALGIAFSSVCSMLIGVSIGRALLLREQKEDVFELIKSVEKEIELLAKRRENNES